MIERVKEAIKEHGLEEEVAKVLPLGSGENLLEFVIKKLIILESKSGDCTERAMQTMNARYDLLEKYKLRQEYMSVGIKSIPALELAEIIHIVVILNVYKYKKSFKYKFKILKEKIYKRIANLDYIIYKKFIFKDKNYFESDSNR